MIILNQNKNIIVNFDSISTIERNGHKISCYFKDSPIPQLLGEYPTDKRANEVLNNIVEFYDDAIIESRNNDYEAHYYNCHKAYIMPEE